MKNFAVLSRKAAKDISCEIKEPTIIISISDVDQEANNFHNNPYIKDILRLWFDDVEVGKSNCMDRHDATRIIKFINKNINIADNIIVHCGAGVSRSAGIAAALMLILNDDDSPIFNNGRYCPNMTCYRLVLNAYYGSYDEEVIQEKVARNIVEWRKLNGFD